MRLWFGMAGLVLGLGAALAADTIPATGGSIELTPMAHAHVQIELSSHNLSDFFYDSLILSS